MDQLFVRLFRSALVSGLLCLFVCAARADAHADVQRLINRQEWPQALSAVSQHLKTKEQDPQMRLLLSRIQEGQGQSDAAMATLLELTRAYPELPEPHNNLAALYARDGRFEDALASLNRAVLARPDYATALENMGDLYAALAKQAFDKAAKAAPPSPRSQSKAQALERLLQPDPR